MYEKYSKRKEFLKSKIIGKSYNWWLRKGLTRNPLLEHLSICGKGLQKTNGKITDELQKTDEHLKKRVFDTEEQLR